jgi:hypothetical protein
VVKVTPSGVQVQTDELLHFDKDGKGSYEERTYEFGEWRIDEMPFADRTALREALDKALLEQGTRRDMKTTLEIGQDVYVVSDDGSSRRSR